MTEQSNVVWVDLRLSLKPSHGRFGIGHKIARRCCVVIARRASDSTLIVAKNGNAVAIQRVG